MGQLRPCGLFSTLNNIRDPVDIEHGKRPIELRDDGKDFSVVCQIVKRIGRGQDIVHVNAVKLLLHRGHRTEA